MMNNIENINNHYLCTLVDEDRLEVARVMLPKIPNEEDEIIVGVAEYEVIGVRYCTTNSKDCYVCNRIEVVVEEK